MSNVNYIVASLIILLFTFLSVQETVALNENKPVTPYGDSCTRCSKYGVCKYTMSHEDAKQAMTDYYHNKGYTVQLINKRGRFIKAKVSDQNKVVDIIIFDRKTGRIRSIY